ncbi:MAG: peptidyl-alpha-hydroxyglycine alpha-amidating lyase family protein [Terriglobia bacterium]
MKIAVLTMLGAATLCAQAPEIAFEGNIDFLKWPAHTNAGEIAGVATTAKGNVVVYTRTGESATAGASRIFTHGGSRLFEFDATGRYVREIGQGVYGFLFAQSVKVDPQDNIWVVDRGSDMVLKFEPSGRIALVLGRKPESVSLEARAAGGRGRGAVPGDNFNRPVDVAFDTAGNIFVADSYANARIAKFDKDGKFISSWGSKGSGPGQFDMPNSIAVDAHGDVYVADPGNKRIQIFDNNGIFKSQISNAGSPWAICISPGAHQYLFSSNSNAPDSMENGEIYKLELDGHPLGRFGKAGKLVKEFGAVNQLDCRDPRVLYAGEVTNWRVQKISLR